MMREASGAKRLRFIWLSSYQGVWFIGVYGVLSGWLWAGSGALFAWGLIRSVCAGSQRQSFLSLSFESALLGYFFDSLLVLSGAISFPVAFQLGGPSPLWMVALWFAFGAAFEDGFGWLRTRPRIAVVLGALGGSIAYWGGARLGALTFPHGVGYGLTLTGICWGLAFPSLLVLLVYHERARVQKMQSLETNP